MYICHHSKSLDGLFSEYHEKENIFNIITCIDVFNVIGNNIDISDSDTGFAWLKPHSGDYDVPEAY